MRIAVALVPAPQLSFAPTVSVVIDVLRATTTRTTVVERGATTVLMASKLDRARGRRRAESDFLFLGEIDGATTPSADMGNTPLVASRAAAYDWAIAAPTSNGTAAISCAAAAKVMLLDYLRNVTATVRGAMYARMSQGEEVTIIRAGANGGTSFALDDTLVASLFAHLLAQVVRSNGETVTLDDGAFAALSLYRVAFEDSHGNAARVTWSQRLPSTVSDRHLYGWGVGDGIAFSAVLDTTSIVARAMNGLTGQRLVTTGMTGARESADLDNLMALPCN